MNLNYRIVEIYVALVREHERKGRDLEYEARNLKIDTLWRRMTSYDRDLAEKATDPNPLRKSA